MPTIVVPPSSFLCVCLLERLQGNNLPGAASCCFLHFVAVLGGWVGGGQQQDAMGEKQSGGSAAAALGQDPHAGQGQVGSGLCWVKLL